MHIRLVIVALVLAASGIACTEHHVDGRTWYCDQLPELSNRTGCISYDQYGAPTVILF